MRAVIALAILLACAPAWGDDPATHLLAEINRVRQDNGLTRLRPDARLAGAARDHAVDMMARDYFDHRAPGGPGLAARARSAGYEYGHVAENIAAGQTDAAEVVASWLESPGHRRNLLNAELIHAGIAYLEEPNDGGDVRYGRYWVAIFARPLR